jgi:hypothetical protein
MKSINISDLDCIYLSSDQQGLSAYQAAAKSSSTERFILVDASCIPDEDFFKQTLELSDDVAELATLQWKSRNYVNGLVNDLGGLISCTRTVVNHMTTGDFASDPLYRSMHDCYSTTYCNVSAFQSWSAGFIAGVRLCLHQGVRPSTVEFLDCISQTCRDQLSVWHNIGRDAEHGIWSIAGSRMGTYMMMITPQWDYQVIQHATELEKLWDTVKDAVPEILAGRIAEDLATQLKLPMISMLAPESAFFKQHYKSNRPNLGIMIQD